ncbi:type IV toxin-antitoxin system AbiEi family antitoxin domain-containing protein [Paenarthrobacter ilicis]|uniref:Very-short-patch-repair endonuclease/predicted transcriptional regulator of viral defense system n=1 Tax=Paenarthrobacter ilicis TaxID=43665 RepID=A0ABX0TFG2_9MICC|nr:type IV toxin-antitoxin system AbiEi family antitoxin domain-containing protein [Paenarthrobacter ilicis]MBM7794048.1 very-short-patch-repair endonuclease/predicted transcriptional regulator of viral defense system [Paenarthrobacter ilicis]NIJ00228.1 very-short-patch-repair endonuclease/predicted transcriptional regulator of viral defense system [Paenarthrobacter ilicis]
MKPQKLDDLITRNWPNTLVASTVDLEIRGISDRVLTSGVRSGKLVRLRRGIYVRSWEWRRQSPWDQDLVRIQAHQMGTLTASVYSHASAARLHACSPWSVDSLVHLTTPFSPAQASSGGDVVAHGSPLDPVEVTEVTAPWRNPLRVTSLERTVVDCARLLDFERALVIADQAARKGADFTVMRNYVDSGRIIRGSRRVTRVLDAADPLAESVGETRTRVLLNKLGITDAVSQLEVDTPVGRCRGDFGWPGSSVILEFDGRAKYFDYAPTEEVIYQERRREKALKAMGWEVVRIEWEDLGRPWEVERQLRAALNREKRRRPAVALRDSNETAGQRRLMSAAPRACP